MKRYILYLVTITILMVSCTEKIDVKLGDTYTRLVVEGSITNEMKSHKVVLTKTTSYFYDEPAPRVTGALISITDGNTIFPLTETSPGTYETASDVKGEAGKFYTLNISNVYKMI